MLESLELTGCKLGKISTVWQLNGPRLGTLHLVLEVCTNRVHDQLAFQILVHFTLFSQLAIVEVVILSFA